MSAWLRPLILVSAPLLVGRGSIGYTQLAECDCCDGDNSDGGGEFCACVLGGAGLDVCDADQGQGGGCHLHVRSHCDYYSSCEPVPQDDDPLTLSGRIVAGPALAAAEDRIVTRSCDGAIVERSVSAQTAARMMQWAAQVRV